MFVRTYVRKCFVKKLQAFENFWGSCSSFDENAIETEDQLSQCIQNTFANISVSAGVFERI